MRARLAIQTNGTYFGLLNTAKIIYSEPNKYNLKGFGVLNFYRGLLPTLLGMIPYAGVSFLSYESLKSWCFSHPIFVNRKQATQLNAEATLLCGAISGMAAQTVSYPIEVIRRNMQVASIKQNSEIYNTISGSAIDIFKNRGLKGFFVGLGLGYVKVIPMFAVSFFSYEYLKRTLKID